MSVITIPAAVSASMGGQSYGQQRFDLEDVSPVDGSAFAVLLGPPRWTMGLRSMQAMPLLTGGEWEAMLLKLRGGVNLLAIHDHLRPAPIGTMRGTPRLATDVAIGDTTATLDNVIGTLERGDWLSLSAGFGSSQLIKLVERVSSAVLAPGAFSWTLSATPFTWTLGGNAFTWALPGAQVTITFEAPARLAFGPLTAVVWDKPVGYYRLANSSVSWQARANGPAMDGFAADFVEQWA